MIEVRNVTKTFAARGGILSQGAVQAVKGVNFTIPDAGAVAFIGESGCGKTTIGRMLTGMETYDSGEILFDGIDLGAMSRQERQDALRRVQLIQQDPYAALNPSRTIYQSLMAPLTHHAKRHGKSTQNLVRRARELLELVGLNPEIVLPKYPHTLSGGQRQRVVIARALTVEPTVLVADEAVSMIDVSLRLGILTLLQNLRKNYGIGLLFITHDVAAARYIGDDGRIYVIYQGEIVEEGTTDEIIRTPVHPYTQALLSAVPVLRGLEQPGPDRYIPLGDFSLDVTAGCRFAARCKYVQDICHVESPVLQPWPGNNHQHLCHFPVARRVVAEAIEEVDA